MDINEVARRAGVSRTTVSRYLNDGYVSQEKRKAIAAVIEETGYRPSQSARALCTGRTKVVGVIIPKLASEAVSRMVNGISRSLEAAGYQTLLGNTANDEAMEVEYLKLFSERNGVDGIILIATVFTPEHRKAMDALKIPLVILGQNVDGRLCVYHDDYNATRELTHRLLATSSHPAFVGVTEKDQAAGHMRHQAFLDACREAGVDVPGRAQGVAGFSVDSGYESTERILDEYPEVDALVCATDEIAFGAVACLREYGRSVPDEVQVTGVGDSTLSAISYPSLTSIHHFYETSGRKASDMLVEAMGDSDAAPCGVKMGYRIVSRLTTR